MDGLPEVAADPVRGPTPGELSLPAEDAPHRREILLAHRLARVLAQHRKAGTVNWLRPDSKTQVSVEYENNEPVAITKTKEH